MSWTSDNALQVPTPKPKAKHSMLPVFVVLFLVSYGLMTLLVVEQGRTIENQRSLIQSLFDDSTKLAQLRMKNQQAQAQAQAGAKAHSQTQNPSTQEKPQAHARNDSGIGKLPKPPKPPTDTATMEDERRSVMRI
ncbi:MAG: hypothetical protein ACRD3L_07955 [Terriglobales bacterium]